MTVKHVLLILALLLPLLLNAQQSAFDTDNEGWRASGDPISTIPAWQASGGNPGGYIRVTDAAIGGTWYFEAANRFKGNKCDAYDKFLRWDQFTSDTSNQQPFGGNPDVVLEGAGLTLVFDNAQNPGLTWTHYDIRLREDTGWRLNNINGAQPSQAQFRAALGNITALRIRGEYRSQADFGGLDNVVLESVFRFDLDADNSSGAPEDGFKTDTLCDPVAPVVDVDVLLLSEKPVDSIVVRIALVQNPLLETLSVGALPPTIQAQQNSPGWLTLLNIGAASLADFMAALRTIRYTDGSPNPASYERLVTLRAFTECGEMALRYAYLPIFPAGNAGMGRDTILCAGTQGADLFSLLSDSPAAGGYWQPALSGATGRFVPGIDPPGVFAYIIAGAKGCPGDTAWVEVVVEPSFDLGRDTTLCYGDSLSLPAPAGLAGWQWSDGSSGYVLSITAPGVYVLQGQTQHCIFSDSVQISFVTCETCPVFAPNAFSPNDDGWNDRWQVFLPCIWLRFRLQVFDRWGNLLFESSDPDQSWDGYWRGKSVPPGVYAWQMEWEGELFGQQQITRKSGDLTLIR